jgi:hypothetical protein
VKPSPLDNALLRVRTETARAVAEALKRGASAQQIHEAVGIGIDRAARETNFAKHDSRRIA